MIFFYELLNRRFGFGRREFFSLVVSASFTVVVFFLMYLEPPPN